MTAQAVASETCDQPNQPEHLGQPEYPGQPEQPDVTTSSYAQILRSSSIIGGAQVVNMLISLVRTKLVAILIGPAGVGLVGIYQSIMGLTSTIAGLGIQTSGVRDVAKHYGSGDEVAIAKTVTTLRRVCWFTGLAGLLLLTSFSPWISEFSFGTRDHAWAIATLGLAILLGNIEGGQYAIIQGTRRIGDLARISVCAAAASTIVSVGFYAVFGLNGIVPAIVTMAVISLGISTYFARRISLPNHKTSLHESFEQARSLVGFGIALVVPAILGAGVTYAIRILVTQHHGLPGVGIYSAAFSLSGMFVQFVLGAMGADFYPRLTAESHDRVRMTQLINEQTEIGLLLAFPGLLATLTFAPLVISIFYTADFAPAADLLKWFVLGCMGRVLSWPLGFSLLAKGQGRLFMATEATFHVMHLGIVWFGLHFIGLTGVAIAFAILYGLYTTVMLLLNRITISFSWSKSVKQQLAWMIPVPVICFGLSEILPQIYSTATAGCVAVVSGVLCLRQLAQRVGPHHRIAGTIRAIPGGAWLLSGKATP